MALVTTKARAAAALDAILADWNSGGTGFTIEIRTGAPAGLANAAGGALLATFDCTTPANPAFGATNTTTLQADGDVSGGTFAECASISGTGTAGHFRVIDHASNPVYEGTVGTSSADLIVNSVSFVTGGTASIDTASITISGLHS